MTTQQRIEEILKEFNGTALNEKILKLMLEVLVLQAQLEQLQGEGGDTANVCGYCKHNDFEEKDTFGYIEDKIRRILMLNFDNDKYGWSKAHSEFIQFITELLTQQHTKDTEEFREKVLELQTYKLNEDSEKLIIKK